MTNLKVQRNEFLDFSKGILITLVCIGHAVQYAVYQNNNFWLDPLFKSIYLFHMPLFMAISGYLSYNGITKATSSVKYLANKSVSYILPIFAWATVYMFITFYIIGHGELKNIGYKIFYEAINSLWFLWSLIISVLLTVIANLAGKYKFYLLIIFFAILLALPEIGFLFLLKNIFPFFVIGFFIAGIDLSKIQLKNLKLLAIIVAIGSCVCFFFWSIDTYIYVTKMTLSIKNIPNIILRWIAGVIASVFAILLLYYVYLKLNLKVKGVLIRAGKDSLKIYIIQSYAYYIILIQFQRYFKPISNVLAGNIVAIIIGVAVAFVTWCIGNIIAKNKVLGGIFFGKSIFIMGDKK